MVDLGGEIMKSDEEEELLQKLIPLKEVYQNKFNLLKGLKSEIMRI